MLRRLAAVAVVAGCATSAPEASAEPASAPEASAEPTTAARCVSDAEHGQKARDEGRLLEGRALFVRCGAVACPAVVSRECVRWLAEIDERIPTIVVVAKDGAGKDLLASIDLDGQPLDPSKVGREIQVDPGPHMLSAAVAGYVSAKETVVVREREKGRPVLLALRSTRAPPAALAVKPPGKGESPPSGRRVPALSWVLGGVALVGVGGFAYFWANGMDEVSTLRGTCAPYCAHEQVRDARTSLDVARVSLGIGLAAAIGGVVVYAVAPSRPRARALLNAWRF